MLRGLYTAYTGMLAQQKRMDTISNNLANVNTAGFKKENVVFQSFDAVYVSKIKDPEGPKSMRIGQGAFGVRRGEIYVNFEQGSLQATDDPYNLAIEGSGMFVIGAYDEEGNVLEKYTRDGTFTLNPNGQLVTKDGYFVVGGNGPITIDSSNVRIDEQGKVFADGEYVDQIKLTDFENPETLNKIGSGIFDAAEDTVMTEFGAQVIQGYVEGSNVSSIDEMVNIINVMRSYETNQKMLMTCDATLEKAVNEVGRV